MRKLEIGTHRFTEVVVLDELGTSGACHEYGIARCSTKLPSEPFQHSEFGIVKFQKGPIKENGVNGCHQEGLIAIVIDRL